eukprot:7032750-Pyramimonas_sp.AAC.1
MRLGCADEGGEKDLRACPNILGIDANDVIHHLKTGGLHIGDVVVWRWLMWPRAWGAQAIR